MWLEVQHQDSLIPDVLAQLWRLGGEAHLRVGLGEAVFRLYTDTDLELGGYPLKPRSDLQM